MQYWSRGGDYDYFKKVVDARGAPSVAGKLSFDDMGGVGTALFMFLFVDFMDTSGTLYAMASYAGLLDAKGNFEGQYVAFLVDGLATTIGAVCGTSPVTTYIESAPGILEGGRTGLTAVVVSLCFLLSLFFAPILASIPPWCTAAIHRQPYPLFAYDLPRRLLCLGPQAAPDRPRPGSVPDQLTLWVHLEQVHGLRSHRRRCDDVQG